MRPLLALLLLLLLVAHSPGALTTITISDEVIRADVHRMGINLGGHSRWGAAQILKNVIENPGLEGGTYGTVFHAATGATGTRVPIDFWNTTWNNDQYGIGMPAGFWDGADWEIVHGPAAGRAGSDPTFTHEDNRYTLYLDEDGTAPQQWDVLFLRRVMAPGHPIAAGDGPPETLDSRGILDLTHSNQPWNDAYNFYMDSLWRDGDRTAGKLMVVEGPWRVTFSARASTESAGVRVQFFREGEGMFIDETATLTTAWQHLEWEVNVAPGADEVRAYTDEEYHPILGFRIQALNPGDVIQVDNVELMQADQSNPTVFSDRLVDALRDYSPGVLRNWKTYEFGGRLDTMISPAMTRGTTGWRPHERRAGQWDYSMHEFLELCFLLQTEPWQIIPPTMPEEDLLGFVEYLAAPADGSHPWADRRAALGQVEPWTQVFPTIHIEFGNELWGSASGGDPFMGASLLGGDRLGAIAGDRFAIMRSSPDFDADRLDLIIGGQAGYPGRQAEIEANSDQHDTVALAPYFGVLNTWANDGEIFQPLFARAFDDVTNGRVRESQGHLDAAGQGTRMAIYELNFHTTHGSSPLDVRNDYVTGQGGAIALPLHMLLMQRELGVDLQCAFAALQYSFRMESGEMVRLWGMLRDLEATARRRPTWLGVELANRAIRGDLITTLQSGANPTWTQLPINGVSEQIDVPEIVSFAYRQGTTRSLILFNLSLTEPHQVTLALPATPTPAATLHRLAPADIHTDNEDAENVVIETSQISTFADGHPLSLPPHSVQALIWTDAGAHGVAIN